MVNWKVGVDVSWICQTFRVYLSDQGSDLEMGIDLNYFICHVNTKKEWNWKWISRLQGKLNLPKDGLGSPIRRIKIIYVLLHKLSRIYKSRLVHEAPVNAGARESDKIALSIYTEVVPVTRTYDAHVTMIQP